MNFVLLFDVSHNLFRAPPTTSRSNWPNMNNHAQHWFTDRAGAKPLFPKNGVFYDLMLVMILSVVRMQMFVH